MVEDELVGAIGLGLGGQRDSVVLDFHFAGEVDLHLDGHDVETVFIDVGLEVEIHSL